jgi:hypothetical protein
MNTKLVEKLALEAGWTPVPGADFSNSLQEIYNQKLVRLVVLECARVDSEHNNPYHVVGESYNGPILEHFGIEP